MDSSLNKEHIRIMILYDFKSGVTPSESYRRLSNAFGENCISKKTVYNWCHSQTLVWECPWYKQFEKGNMKVADTGAANTAASRQSVSPQKREVSPQKREVSPQKRPANPPISQPPAVSTEDLLATIDANPTLPMNELAQCFGTTQSTIEMHLEGLDRVWEGGRWVKEVKRMKVIKDDCDLKFNGDGL